VNEKQRQTSRQPANRGTAVPQRLMRGVQGLTPDFGRAAETGVTGEETTPCFSPAEYGALPGKVSE
jgi:hypothetical protein